MHPLLQILHRNKVFQWVSCLFISILYCLLFTTCCLPNIRQRPLHFFSAISSVSHVRPWTCITYTRSAAGRPCTAGHWSIFSSTGSWRAPGRGPSPHRLSWMSHLWSQPNSSSAGSNLHSCKMASWSWTCSAFWSYGSCSRAHAGECFHCPKSVFAYNTKGGDGHCTKQRKKYISVS